MAYDEGLAARATEALGDQDGLVEKKMFGGIGYLVHGNMACGVNRDSLIIRVGPAIYEDALDQPHTGIFDMTGRPMKGWIVVRPNGYEDDEALTAWIQKAIDFALTLPGK